jgi:hypothetical protein
MPRPQPNYQTPSNLLHTPQTIPLTLHIIELPKLEIFVFILYNKLENFNGALFNFWLILFKLIAKFVPKK